MDQRKMCLESFTKDTFDAFVSALTDEGYVIDGRQIHGIPFSSTQIEHLDQDVFDQLCVKFGVSVVLKISSTGEFFNSQGAFYIVYDTDAYGYESARQILSKYVDGLPA